MLKDDNLTVPNFIGGSLPRCDRGDREYYCCTMMTLFKPWRTGKDLKAEDQTWDESFTNHSFDNRSHEIIKYFNVRYECLDARDDFSAKQERGDNGSIIFQWKPDKDEFDWDEVDKDEEKAATGADFLMQEEETLESIRYRENFEKRLEEMKRIIISSGWLDQSTDGLPDVDLTVYGPDVMQAAHKWQAAVQAKRQQLIAEKNKNMPKQQDNKYTTRKDPLTDDVKVVNKAYLDKTYRAGTTKEQDIIESTCSKYNLNTDQERAFRIVANHATELQPEILKMYLGGMGGTGKSRVIEALIQFFKDRSESHRFLVVAPTGSAAALLNGSTYHSVLGINDRKDRNVNLAKNAAQVRAKLDGVEYIFLDEVSMLSCHDLYRVSATAANATSFLDEPFGGINMIFAEDFAQLPPVNGSALYSSNVGTQVQSSMLNRAQEETIGKALWHQITTVVILKENMRPQSQSLNDQKLRTALENMRYKACTQEDIDFL